MGVVTITSNLRAWLQYQLGPSWHVLIWFLGLSGVIGFFANLRAIIELFALVLMGIYLVTDPLFDRVLSKFGEDNQDHVVSNILIYVLASLILTLVFTVMKRRSILRQLEAAEAEKAWRAEQARSQRNSEAESEGSAAVGGAFLGGLLGLGLGLIFLPVLPAVAGLGALIGGLAGAGAEDEERAVEAALDSRSATYSPTDRRALERNATRQGITVFLSTMLKAALICGLIGVLTYNRSEGWNRAMEMELRTELAIAKVACTLQPEDTYVLQLEPIEVSKDKSIEAPKDPYQPNFCREELELRRAELKLHRERREAAEAAEADRKTAELARKAAELARER